ncbi:MAG: tetratricopeptide repeat protein, partial [Candidatus Zixiibacteriota bacterium]
MNKGILRIALCIAAIAGIVLSSSSPANAGVNQKEIESALEAGDTTGALATLTAASNADAKDYLALYWQGRIAYARGQWQEARDFFQRSLDIKSKHYESLYHFALSQMHLGEFEAAYANIRKGSKKARTMRIEFKGAEDTLSRLQEEFARTGGLSDDGGESSHASMSAPSEDDLRAKVKSDPREPLNHFALGKFLYDQGRYAAADSSFLIALKRDKKHDLSNYFHGLSLIKLGKLNEAEKLFEKRLKKAKTFKAEYNNGLGLVF